MGIIGQEKNGPKKVIVISLLLTSKVQDGFIRS